MRRETLTTLLVFGIGIVCYSVLVTGYFLFVVHFLSDEIVHFYRHNRGLYSALALLLIIGQGVILEAITTGLMNFIRARLE